MRFLKLKKEVLVMETMQALIETLEDNFWVYGD
jgi:hypothetical protein